MTTYDITVPSDPDRYVAVGGEAEFVGHFQAETADQVVVLLDGEPLENGVDYSISGLETGDPVTIKLDVTAYPSGATAGQVWVVYRETEISRSSGYEQRGRFSAAAINDDLDLIVMMVQEARRDIDRSLRLAPEATTTSVVMPEFEEGRAIIWGRDSDGNQMLTNSTTSISSIENAQAWALAAQSSANAAALAAAAAAAAAGAALGDTLSDADADTTVSCETSTDSDAIDLVANGSAVGQFTDSKIELGRASTPNVYVDVLDDTDASSAAGDNGALRVQGGVSVVGKVYAGEFHGDGSNLSGLSGGWVGKVEFGFFTSLPTGTLPGLGETIGAVGSGADYEHADYEDLFDILKTFTELGNAGTESFAGLDTVTMPDYGNAFPRGTGSGSTVGASGGAASNTIAAANLPALTGTTAGAGAHSHPFDVTVYKSVTGSGSSKGLMTGSGSGAELEVASGGSHAHTVAVNSGSANTAITNLPPYVNCLAVIRYA